MGRLAPKADIRLDRRGDGWLEVEGDSAPHRSLCDIEAGPAPRG